MLSGKIPVRKGSSRARANTATTAGSLFSSDDPATNKSLPCADCARLCALSTLSELKNQSHLFHFPAVSFEIALRYEALAEKDSRCSPNPWLPSMLCLIQLFRKTLFPRARGQWQVSPPGPRTPRASEIAFLHAAAHRHGRQTWPRRRAAAHARLPVRPISDGHDHLYET